MAVVFADTTVVLYRYFSVRSSYLEDFKKGFHAFTFVIDAEQEKILYIDFSIDEANGQVLFRQCHEDAEGLSVHLKVGDGPLKASLKLGSLDRVEAHGPKHELEKLKEVLPSTCKYYETEAGASVYNIQRGSEPKLDTSVALVPRFAVHHGKLEDFKAGFKGFFEKINPEEEHMLYYGFTVDTASHTVLCREGYKNAAGLLKHLENVSEPLKAALEIASLESLEVHGPAEELELLKSALVPLSCKFFTVAPESRAWTVDSHGSFFLWFGSLVGGMCWTRR